MEMNKVSVNQPNHNKEFYDDVLLPGFRFHPTDEELVSFYLKRKVEKKPLSIDFIKNIDIYKYNPWDLPSMCNKLGKNQEEWYFFCKRGRKYRNSARPNRVITGSGFWKATGIDRPVYGSTAGAGGSDDGRHGCVGLKKSLVFYRGAAGKGTKTAWMMHEFRLPITNFYTTGAQNRNDSFQDEAEVWTLCRILKRDISQRKDVSAGQHQKNSKLIEKPIFNMNSCSTNTTDSSENPTSLHNEGSYKNFFSETSSNLQVPMLSSSGNPNDEGSSLTTKNDEDDMIHIVSWIECLDLRMLAVLANSTLSSSRYPDRIYFHFFAPEGNKDMVSFYRLKVLFPYTNIQFHGQEEVEEIIRGAISETQFGSLNVAEIAPFVVPIVHQSLGKFIFVSPDVIIKGGVDELVAVELGSHAVAAAEDCSKRLNTYVNSDVLGAVQRSASKPWVSETPYDKNSCMPESSLLLIDARKIRKDFLDGLLWWSRVLNLSERNNQNNPVLALALYDRYLKLSNSWFVRDSGSPEIQNGIAAIRYDGPKSVCSGLREDAVVNSSSSNLWSLYLPPLSDQILGI